jgi:uncharacterized MnhB-related membrane protein
MNGPLLVAFDGLLAGLLVWLAWRALSVADLFKGIVLFIAFGLCMALAWVRLNAPDIALAEAAVGSGITGALLLAAWNRMRSVPTAPPASSRPPARVVRRRARLGVRPRLRRLGAALGWAVLSLPLGGEGLAGRALAALPRSGTTNPVTAALLNYRAYDTLLELGVLLLAVIGAWAMARADDPPADVPRGPVLRRAGACAHATARRARGLLPVGRRGEAGWRVPGRRPARRRRGPAAARARRRPPPAAGIRLARLVFVAGLAVFVAVGLGVGMRATPPARVPARRRGPADPRHRGGGGRVDRRHAGGALRRRPAGRAPRGEGGGDDTSPDAGLRTRRVRALRHRPARAGRAAASAAQDPRAQRLGRRGLPRARGDRASRTRCRARPGAACDGAHRDRRRRLRHGGGARAGRPRAPDHRDHGRRRDVHETEES